LLQFDLGQLPVSLRRPIWGRLVVFSSYARISTLGLTRLTAGKVPISNLLDFLRDPCTRRWSTLNRQKFISPYNLQKVWIDLCSEERRRILIFFCQPDDNVPNCLQMVLIWVY
jgi:hypothetical protein